MDLGDLDLDGYGDAYIESRELRREGTGRFVIHVSAEGPPRVDVIPDPPTEIGSERYTGVIYPNQIGDLDGDGRPDFVLVPESSANVLVYRGARGLELPAVSLRGSAIMPDAVTNGNFGWRSAGGDLNGDGLADLLIAAHGAYTETRPWIDGSRDPYNSGRMYVFWGRTDGVAREPIWFDRARPTDPMENPTGFAYRIASPGDLDGDGIDDAVIVDLSRNQICYVRGSTSLSTSHLGGCTVSPGRGAVVL